MDILIAPLRHVEIVSRGNLTMSKTMTVLIGLFVAFWLPSTFADADRSAQAKEVLAEAMKRLDLSDDQVEQIKPILESSGKAQRAILERYGIDPDTEPGEGKQLSMSEALALRKEMEKVRTKTLDQLEGILSRDQLREFQKMQDEQRAEMKKRIKRGR